MISVQKKHKDLFLIIKAALTDSSETVDGEIDYEELFVLSRKHQIVPMVLQGLYNTVGDFEAKEKFYEYTFYLMCHNQNQTYWLDEIQKIFENNHIDYMLLKGSSVKGLYPTAEMRLMGDIDILIKEEQYPEIQNLLSQAGLQEIMVTDHELIWKGENGVQIELHRKLIPSYNDDYYTYYCKPWEKAVFKEGNRYAMSVEDEYIYIFTHLTKHYRDGGIGLRHIIDIWYFNRCYPEMDMGYIQSELEKLELAVFHQHILDTIEVWLCGKKANELTDYITERIIESGSYGIKEKCDMANAARLSATSESVVSAKRSNIFSAVLMPYSSMKKKYPVLRRMPFLLPVMWVVRWIDAIVNKRDHISRRAERIQKINADVVDRYTEELQMVGLKFSLKKCE